MNAEKNYDNQQGSRYLLRFRAFNRDNGTLYKWDIFEGYPLNGKNATYPQEFTGYYDKNLKDIFVGDIVNYCKENFLVKYFEGGYIFYKIENRDESTLKFHWFHDIGRYKEELEVVGNTFENADYLVAWLNNELNFQYK